MDDANYLEFLYEKFKHNRNSITPDWVDYFEALETAFQRKEDSLTIDSSKDNKDAYILNLINAYRSYGYLYASMNKQKSLDEIGDLLSFKEFGFCDEDLSKEYSTRGLLKDSRATLKQIIESLNQMYCSSIGIEYKGTLQKTEQQWFESLIEKRAFDTKQLSIDKKKLFEELSKAELFEAFLHNKFVGQTRFSLEGAETLLPLLNGIIKKASDEGVQSCQIGMSHRGRINVLVNVLQKSYNEVFYEFEDVISSTSFQSAGDVKYHKGFNTTLNLENNKSITINLLANPSHLESVVAVTEGATKALQVKNHDDSKNKNLSILIHGDAAIAGQGVVYEALQLQLLNGYSTGGSIHIVVNNKIGFTTTPNEYMSTFYCTDIAKAFGCPVFHVDADDVESTYIAGQLAIAFRAKFSKDVFINLNCYRKYGHNEGDEPLFTQPKAYASIKSKKTISQRYLEKLVEEGVFTKNIKEGIEKNFKDNLHSILEDVKKGFVATSSKELLEKFEQAHYPNDSLSFSVDTSISLQHFKTLVEKIISVPDGFEAHKKILAILDYRRGILSKEADDKVIDWSFAETIAFASVLWQGHSVRLSGEDSRRGTFSQRHSCFVDQNNENKYFPLSHLKTGQGLFDVYDSPLSEFAVLGFEYGYSVFYNEALVVWEAQYGDFSNEAQVIIDEYIMGGQQRWGKPSKLTLFLPHGFEGQGPEHSSAKMERFLQLTNKGNVVIVNPTTPAQLFHLLRRQVLEAITRPLIVFTPKGLLRNPKCLSSINDFIQNSFQDVLDDEYRPQNPKKLLFCSGRIYYDLCLERNKRNKEGSIAIIRIEQLYPLNIKKLKSLIFSYEKIDNYIWIQEEPQNMGAWNYIKPTLEKLLMIGKQLQFIGRKPRATAAVGSYRVHLFEYEILMKEVFED